MRKKPVEGNCLSVHMPWVETNSAKHGSRPYNEGQPPESAGWKTRHTPRKPSGEGARNTFPIQRRFPGVYPRPRNPDSTH